MENLCGALVERGRVIRIEDDGKCVLESLDRPGIVTLPLATAPGAETKEGSIALFCEFADGSGAVFMSISM